MYNKCVMLGRLTKDPEVRTVGKDSKKVCDFTLAVDKFNDDANFINCQVWNKTAEYLGKYGKKGSVVMVDGSLEINSYNSKEGNSVTRYFILSNMIKLIGGSSTSGSNNSQEQTFDPSELNETTEKAIEFEPKQTFEPELKTDGLVVEESLPF